MYTIDSFPIPFIGKNHIYQNTTLIQIAVPSRKPHPGRGAVTVCPQKRFLQPLASGSVNFVGSVPSALRCLAFLLTSMALGSGFILSLRLHSSSSQKERAKAARVTGLFSGWRDLSIISRCSSRAFRYGWLVHTASHSGGFAEVRQGQASLQHSVNGGVAP